MGKQANPYPLRIDKEILEKSKFIAKENGRSLNKEIEFILKSNVNSYENKYGEIKLPQNLFE